MGKKTGDAAKTAARRFFEWIERTGLTYKKYADTLGVSTQALTNWKRRGIPADKLERVADIMGIPVAILVSQENDETAAELAPRVRMIPVLDYVHAGQWNQISEGAYTEMLPAIDLDGENVFYLRVEGDSMRPEFREGDVIAIDPDRNPNPGDYVVAQNGDCETTFKKYREVGFAPDGRKVVELVPLNPDYASIRSDATALRIIGVLVASYRDYKHRR